MPADTIGTQAWWDGEAHFGPRGIAEVILRLLEQEEISRRKAVELLRAMAWRGVGDKIPHAPWNAVQWGEVSRER